METDLDVFASHYPLRVKDLDTGKEYEYAKVVSNAPFYLVADKYSPTLELVVRRIDRAEVTFIEERMKNAADSR